MLRARSNDGAASPCRSRLQGARRRSVRPRGKARLAGKEPTLVEQVFPVGDVDGDGAGDLLSLSQLFPGLSNEDGELQLPPSGDAEAWQPYPVNELSVHFGTPGGSAAQSVR